MSYLPGRVEGWRAGPGHHRARSDLVRLTSTIRQRNTQQLIVRTSAQFFLRPDAYQEVYATLEKTLFLTPR